MTETEVYKAVSLLFRDEEDLMRDFKSFLPDAGLESPDKQSNIQKEENSPALLSTGQSATNASSIIGSEKSDTENTPIAKSDLDKLTKKRPLENTSPNTLSAKYPKVSLNLQFKKNKKCINILQVFFRKLKRCLRLVTK